MEKFTIEDFQKNFDELIERVESGESFIIESKYGDSVIAPYRYARFNEECEYFCDHDDGC